MPRRARHWWESSHLGPGRTDHKVADDGHGGFPHGTDWMVLGYEAVGVLEAP